jgi:hypothetical protein
MKYFHRTSLGPDAVLERATTYFGRKLTPTEESPRHREYSGSIGRIRLDIQAEGGHYTLVTVATDQPGEGEADKLAKRFLTLVHTMVHTGHEPRGAY